MKDPVIFHGFEQVETANDPLYRLKELKAGSYDLLIIDIVMPEMDGFSLYEEVRKIDNKVKICFITAFEVNYRLELYFLLRLPLMISDASIRKPVDRDDLVKRIKAEIQSVGMYLYHFVVYLLEGERNFRLVN